MKDFICPNCKHRWSAEPDDDELYNGRGCPLCPDCGVENGVSVNDYGDFRCFDCGYEFHRYGNGGLHLGMVPRCPKCNGYCNVIR